MKIFWRYFCGPLAFPAKAGTCVFTGELRRLEKLGSRFRGNDDLAG